MKLKTNNKFFRQSFEGWQNLKSLDLRFNQIREIPEDVFADLTQLRKIDLSNNFITVLPNGLFGSMRYLIKFIFNENSIEIFDAGIFQRNNNLEEIHLWHNKIKAVRINLKNHKKLETIDLRENV